MGARVNGRELEVGELFLNSSTHQKIVRVTVFSKSVSFTYGSYPSPKTAAKRLQTMRARAHTVCGDINKKWCHDRVNKSRALEVLTRP